jgi:hypothetical protein
MANISAGRVATATLTANTVDLVFLTAPGQTIKVSNQSGTAPIFYTVSHPGGACPVPTVNGSNCYAVASVAGTYGFVRHDGMYGSIVQLISAGTPQYTVEVTSKNAPN